MIYLGADHRGFQLKEEIKKFLAEKKYEFEDMGNFAYDPNDDYTDFAKLVAQKVAELKNLPISEVSDATFNNAKNLFKF